MSRGRVSAAVGIYGFLGGIAWLATAATGHSPWHLASTVGGSRWISLPFATVAGFATGWAGVGVSRWLVAHTEWGRALHRELRLGLAGVSPPAATPLALASSLGEELVFRGALQAAFVALLGGVVGVALAAALFGIIHVPWNRRLVPWTLMACFMGVVFGALYFATGELLAPLITHAVINRENLRYILRFEPPASKLDALRATTLPVIRRA